MNINWNCFGTNEVYLEQSNIHDKNIIKSDSKNIHALNIGIELIKRKSIATYKNYLLNFFIEISQFQI